jgi:uncharacterized integral membrane protein (TIGR00698 family)
LKAYWAIVVVAAGALVAFDAPSWLALLAGLVMALAWRRDPPKTLKRYVNLTLQLGIVALGAGMHLDVVLRTGRDGALITATSLSLAIVLGLALGKLLKVPGDTPLMISVGTAICGGSAIAAVASVIKPKAQEMSVALGVVFVLNAVGLLIFPPIGHALGLSQTVFGRWAALAIHDTSSVVGAGREYGAVALSVATTTKLARALWIVPVTIATAVMRQREGLRNVKWPWFILGFVAMAALVTWVPATADIAPHVAKIGTRSLVVALFLIGLSLSRKNIQQVGPRPFVMGVILWIVIACASLLLATLP